MAEEGISVSFSEPEDKNGKIKIVCLVRVGSVEKPFESNPPRPIYEDLAKQMYLTVPQAYGLALSYYKRYAFCSALNVTVCGEDSDAAAEGVGLMQEIGEGQIAELRAVLRQKGKDEDAFLRWAGVATFDEITLGGFKELMGTLAGMPNAKGGSK